MWRRATLSLDTCSRDLLGMAAPTPFGLALVGAGAVMYAAGFSLNLLTILAIVLSVLGFYLLVLIFGGAVVTSESISRRATSVTSSISPLISTRR